MADERFRWNRRAKQRWRENRRRHSSGSSGGAESSRPSRLAATIRRRDFVAMWILRNQDYLADPRCGRVGEDREPIWMDEDPALDEDSSDGLSEGFCGDGNEIQLEEEDWAEIAKGGNGHTEANTNNGHGEDTQEEVPKEENGQEEHTEETQEAAGGAEEHHEDGTDAQGDEQSQAIEQAAAPVLRSPGVWTIASEFQSVMARYTDGFDIESVARPEVPLYPGAGRVCACPGCRGSPARLFGEALVLVLWEEKPPSSAAEVDQVIFDVLRRHRAGPAFFEGSSARAVSLFKTPVMLVPGMGIEVPDLLRIFLESKRRYDAAVAMASLTRTTSSSTGGTMSKTTDDLSKDPKQS